MARGNNYGSRTWSWGGGAIGGAVFGPAGPLVVRTTYGMTVHHVVVRRFSSVLAKGLGYV